MSSEDKFSTILVACIASVLITMCLVILGCKRDDDQLHAKMVDKGCSYFGDNKFDCKEQNK